MAIITPDSIWPRIPVAMPGEPQITLLFAPQRIDVGVPEAAHIGGSWSSYGYALSLPHAA
jgi:hypothetical protein